MGKKIGKIVILTEKQKAGLRKMVAKRSREADEAEERLRHMRVSGEVYSTWQKAGSYVLEVKDHPGAERVGVMKVEVCGRGKYSIDIAPLGDFELDNIKVEYPPWNNKNKKEANMAACDAAEQIGKRIARELSDRMGRDYEFRSGLGPAFT